MYELLNPKFEILISKQIQMTEIRNYKGADDCRVMPKITYPIFPLTSFLSPRGEEVQTSLLPIGEKVRMRG
ncbi:MAG: hypothetical protein AABY87_06540 [bacterium]